MAYRGSESLEVENHVAGVERGVSRLGLFFFSLRVSFTDSTDSGLARSITSCQSRAWRLLLRLMSPLIVEATRS